MGLYIILLIIGFVLLIKGADVMVEGAASLAKRFGVSSLVIGLTVVASGTSAPELIVNIMASLQGSADIGMGNIVGSNIANTLLVLGLAVVIRRIKIDRGILSRDIPYSIMAVIVLFVLMNGAIINGGGESGLFRSGGIVLISFFLIFLYYSFAVNKKEIEEEGEVQKKKTWISVLMVLGGSAGLFFGGNFIVDSAVFLAQALGMSEALIGLTVIAVGTGLPEIAVVIAAARKGQGAMIIGNVVGSNIFNVLWVLGLSSIIKPIEYSSMMDSDILFSIVITCLLYPLILSGKGTKKFSLGRASGAIMLIVYFVYIGLIVVRG
jgi:cation:H+ antiporter